VQLTLFIMNGQVEKLAQGFEPTDGMEEPAPSNVVLMGYTGAPLMPTSGGTTVTQSQASTIFNVTQAGPKQDTILQPVGLNHSLSAGPLPTTSGMSAMPAGRVAQSSNVPGAFLSSKLCTCVSCPPCQA
jgi:hypothetical protein